MLRLRLFICAVLGAWLLAAPVQARSPEGPALWRIADADSEIWLFGTVRLLPKDFEWRTAPIDAAFAAAQTLILEAPAGEAAGPETQRLIRAYGYNRPGVTLTDRVGADNAARLAAVAGELGAPRAALEPMRPWFAIISVTAQYIVARGFDPAYGVEQVLARQATAEGKAFEYLETVEQQIRLFADLPPEVERGFFEVGLEEIRLSGAYVEDLLAAWRAADLDTLESMLNAEMKEVAPEVYEALIVRRNRAWVEQLAEILEGRGRVFVAVGAAHLVGPDSVPALLRARGIDVARP